ncbi:MAG: 4-hydroxy-tetrahydrodipicolinate reductase [Thermodesulfobacteriota bacterium]|nr:4-hydroxy-tetrahydrodipicolinate reductase [Thermodesulfobacteriota bacterium]
MINTIVIGAGGRMGKTITRMVIEDNELNLVGITEIANSPLIEKSVKEIIGIGNENIKITHDLASIIERCDAIIDFTRPASSLSTLKLAGEYKKAVVIGTTGFTQEEENEAKELAIKTKTVMAPNMSVGINLIFKVIKDVTRIIGNDYDIEIIEAHHRGKKDSPSGTALNIARIIADELKRELSKVAVHRRKGIIGERSKDEIGIQVIRAGDIVGEHTIIFGGTGERLEITHRATNRENFARGAIKAVHFIVNQKDGLYNMEDVLGIK